MSWKISRDGERYYVDADTMPGAQKAHRLAAAAPELLEALELALGSHNRFLMSDPPKDAWVANGVEAKARAAIAKAKGEE